MEWQIVLGILFGGLLLLIATGMPVAFCFITMNIIMAFWLWGGATGIEQIIPSIVESLATFTLLPVALFILMGEVLFHSGIVTSIIETIDSWLGGLPGRLSLLAVLVGTVLGTLTGSALSSLALLGTGLLPEMEKRGYRKPMTLGPIMGSSLLAAFIPPSGVAVILGAIALISIADILIAIILPGLLLAGIFTVYIILRCMLQPNLAPPYNPPPTPISKKVLNTAWHIGPIGIIIFLVIGVIILGIATPSEAAASGAIGCYLLVAIHKKLSWEMVKKSAMGTLKITTFTLLIVSGAKCFSQILAYSGGSAGLVDFVLGMSATPIATIAGMMVIVLILGCFVDVFSILMICIPLFMPIVHSLGFNPVWFAVLMMISTAVGTLTPPFGTCLFVMKGVALPDTTMGDIYRAVIPFIGAGLLQMVLVIAFPEIALCLVSLMR